MLNNHLLASSKFLRQENFELFKKIFEETSPCRAAKVLSSQDLMTGNYLNYQQARVSGKQLSEDPTSAKVWSFLWVNGNFFPMVE
jgi:hypothetical protein